MCAGLAGVEDRPAVCVLGRVADHARLRDNGLPCPGANEPAVADATSAGVQAPSGVPSVFAAVESRIPGVRPSVESRISGIGFAVAARISGVLASISEPNDGCVPTRSERAAQSAGNRRQQQTSNQVLGH